MNSEQLAEWLEQHLPRHLSKILADPQRIKVTHILNWGGFVNHSFSVDCGSARYHLKLASGPEMVQRLKGWRNVHEILEQRYRTPELIDWIDLDEIGFAGLLLRHVEGTTADFCRNPDLVEQLVKLASRLHLDAGIRSHLSGQEFGKTYCDYFVETYIDRFTSDLESIAADPPPFISSSLFRWMQDQTDQLNDQAKRSEAFQNPAIEPVHGDLHEGNVLVAPGDWFIVDWDDLALGDPALEFAILLWPMIYAGKPWREFFNSGTEAGFAERVELCLRAQLLDEVIDNVADYVQAHVVPSKQAEVQLVKKRRHEEALSRYGLAVLDFDSFS